MDSLLIHLQRSRGYLYSLLGIALTVVACSSDSEVEAAVAPRPNILMILADDLGYSDIGAFGGEIKTPNLDALAAEGRVLTQHYAAPTCSPTRAMLISGADHHLVGLGTMAEILAFQPALRERPGYEGYLTERSLSIAELLHDSGYHTYMAGKWHLGFEEDQSPKARGFESSFALLDGAGSHFAPVPGHLVRADSVQYRDGDHLTTVPESYFSSNFFTDKLIEYLQQHIRDGRPFFAYAAYTAPHWPLQAPPDYIDRYKGIYDVGYATIRQRRLDRMRELGILPIDFQANPGLPATPNTPTWDQLSDVEKAIEARKMEIYAAMVENLDANIGRLVRYLKEVGVYDNTFIFFQSDNGAEGAQTFLGGDSDDNSLQNLGRPRSNVDLGRRWAEVSATPFRLHKGFTTEGGMAVPAIARLPQQAGGRSHFSGFTHVTDLAPTFLALAGVRDPGSRYKDRDVTPITGVSLMGVLDDEATATRPTDTVVAGELMGRRYVRKGPWKAVFIEPPWGSGRWALYDLVSDRGESSDLAAVHPDVVAELDAEWNRYGARVGVVTPNFPGMGPREGTP